MVSWMKPVKATLLGCGTARLLLTLGTLHLISRTEWAPGAQLHIPPIIMVAKQPACSSSRDTSRQVGVGRAHKPSGGCGQGNWPSGGCGQGNWPSGGCGQGNWPSGGCGQGNWPSGGCGQGTQAIRWVWAGQLAIRWVWAGQLAIRWVWAGQLAIRWVWAGQLTRTCSSHCGSTIVTCTCAELLACYH